MNKQQLIVCIYEDSACRRFFPLTCLRPVYTLRPGILELFKRAGQYFPDAQVIFACREQIAPLLSETYPDYPVNIIKRENADVLFVNGRIRNWGNVPELVDSAKHSAVFTTSTNEPAAVLFTSDMMKSLPPVITQHEFQNLFETESENMLSESTTATMYNYCWDIIADVETAIRVDYEYLKPTLASPRNTTIHSGAEFVNEDNIFLGDDVTIFPGAVIDAGHGPVYIGNNVKIESHAAIYGPCFIGANTIVLAGKITGSSIGHTCRVGGEVEESIFHAYVNKYHAGFIGHSYVGQWVNFGAMTTNSDLKNNYSTIRMTVDGEIINTGMIKVGSLIGDHTKFGIGTLLTTGINIGVCCNIFGGTLVTDKEVPSFQWGTSGSFVEYKLEKAIETAEKVAERRNIKLSEREKDMLEKIFLNKIEDTGVLSFM